MKKIYKFKFSFFKLGLFVGLGIFAECALFIVFSAMYIQNLNAAIAAAIILILAIFVQGPAILVSLFCSGIWAAFGYHFIYATISLPLSYFTDLNSTSIHYASIPFGAVFGLFVFWLSWMLHAESIGIAFLKEPFSFDENWQDSSDNYSSYEDYIREEVEAERKYREQYERYDQSRQVESALDEKEDPYSVLGITREATQEEIKTAYRNKMKKNHPDKFNNVDDDFKELAKKRSQAIATAYEKLCA